jgi:hypothetical protein
LESKNEDNHWLCILDDVLKSKFEVLEGCVTLKNAKWGANNKSTLVIRECYSTIIQTISEQKYRNVLLQGTPGIGKSFFMYYYIFFLLTNKGADDIVIAVACLFREGRRIFYLSVQNDKFDVLDNYSSTPDYYFSDSVDIEEDNTSKNLTALFASLDEKHFSTFRKVMQESELLSADLYVPVVPMNELVKMTSVSNPTTVQFRRDIYGGSARNCLDNCVHKVTKKVKKDLREYLDEFFEDCTDIDTPSDSNMEWAATTLAFHLGKLFHTDSDLATLERSVVIHQFVDPTDLTPLEKTYCSSVMKYVCGRLIEKLNECLRSRMTNLFGMSGFGILFESVAFDTMYKNLKDGHVYDLKPVQGKGTKDELSGNGRAIRKVLIRSISDIKGLKEGDIGVPVIGNFPVADFILGNDLLQMTVSDSHSVKEGRLEDIRDALGVNYSSMRLIFVTEAKTMKSFSGCPSLMSTIRQYVTTPVITASDDVLGKGNESRSDSSSGSNKKAKLVH